MVDDGPWLDRHAIGASLLFVACSAAMCWPVLREPAQRIAMDTGDPVLNAAILYWNATTVPLTSAWWNFPAFAPATDVTAFTEHLLGLWPLASPMVWITGHPLVAYNVAFFLTFPLSGLAMFALVRSLTGSAAAGVVAGIAFAFAPYRASQFSHVQMLAAYGMPLALLGLHRFRDTGRKHALALFAAGWLLSVLSNSYMLVFFGIFVGCWTLWFCTTRESWRRLPWIAAAGSVSVLALAPILVKYVEVHDRYGFTRPLEEIVAYSADLTALAHPWPELLLSARWLEPTLSEGALFPGVTIVLLAGLAVMTRRRLPSATGGRSPVVFYALMVVVAWILSLGPVARLNGADVASGLPYAWLLELPGVSGLRVPARFWMLGTLSLAVLAGFGAASVSRRRGGRAFIVLAATLMLAEGWTTVRAVPVEAFSPVLPQDRGASVVELPFGDSPLERTAPMLRAVTGAYRTLNGHSGYVPPHFYPLQLGLGLGEGSIATELRRRMPLHLSVRADDADGWRRWVLATQPEAVLVAEAGNRALYRLSPLEASPAAPRGRSMPFAVDAVSCATEPASHVQDGSLATRWHCGPARPGQSISVRLDQMGDVSGVVLRAGAFWSDVPRFLRIEVSRDGIEWDEVWANLPVTAALAAALDDPPQMDVYLPFPATPAQFVRLTQTGDGWDWYWSIAELHVLANGGV